MNRIAEWLQKQFQSETLSFVENRAHGLIFRGVVRDKDMAFLVSASRHVWVEETGSREWKPTGIYVPESMMP